MRPVLGLALLRARARLISLSVAVALFMFLVGLSYAAVDENAVRQLYEALPPLIRAFAGAADVISPEGYLGSSFSHPVLLVALGGVVISMATAPARDLETGVAELMLSRNLSHRGWLSAHAIATAAALLVVAATATVGALVAVWIVDDLREIEAIDLLRASLATVLLFSAVGGIALLCAAGLRSGARAVGFAGGTTVLMYALDYLAFIWSRAEPFAPLSIFHYFDPGVVLARGQLGLTDAAVLATVSLATTLAALAVVARREVSG